MNPGPGSPWSFSAVADGEIWHHGREWSRIHCSYVICMYR